MVNESPKIQSIEALLALPICRDEGMMKTKDTDFVGLTDLINKLKYQGSENTRKSVSFACSNEHSSRSSSPSNGRSASSRGFVGSVLMQNEDVGLPFPEDQHDSSSHQSSENEFHHDFVGSVDKYEYEDLDPIEDYDSYDSYDEAPYADEDYAGHNEIPYDDDSAYRICNCCGYERCPSLLNALDGPPCPAAGRTCHRCNQEGHFQAMCKE